MSSHGTIAGGANTGRWTWDAPAFLDPPEDFTRLETAAAAVIPVPYDGTSTYVKGADKGPEALLRASAQEEMYDIETGTEPCRLGIATLEPLWHPDGQGGTPERLADEVEAAVGSQLDAGRMPVVLGGEHSVSIGAFRAVAARYKDACVLQIDAHGDTREEYHGSACNHACVMSRARELMPIVQVGIRAIEQDEADRLDRARVIFAHEIRAASLTARPDAWMDRVLGLLSPRTYITIDLDGFDPAQVPATGTPVPGGLWWHEVNELLKRVVRRTEVVGFDVVELCPREGEHGSDFLAARLVHRLIAEVFAARR